MKLTKSQIKELIRHSIRELTSEREDVTESKKRRFTVKEVRMWMKKLEENRYKKVYNSDARRVAWMVNNEGRTLDEMPMSMKKKWSKAQYGRERYLATEFLKAKSEQMNESKLRGMIREIIKEQMNEKINLGGAYEKMLDKHNDKLVLNALSLITKKVEKDYKIGKVQRGTKVTKKLVATHIINGMKELRNKSKSPGLKKAFQKIINTREAVLKMMKEEKVNEAYRSQSIFFDKKDKSKLQKLLKKNKGKFPFNPPGESVVNWSLNDRGSKGLEWSGIPKAKYNKAVEFFMKNKLNPRG